MRLRPRLTALTALTLGAGLAILCLAGNVLLSHTIDSDVRGRLTARLDAIGSSLSIASGRIHLGNPITDTVLDSYAWVYNSNGRILEAPGRGDPLSAQARELARQSSMHGAQTHGLSSTLAARGDMLLGSRRIESGGHLLGTIVADVSVATFDSLRRRVLLGSIVVALLTLLVGASAIWRALGAALAPVEQMTRDAADWGAHDLDRRFALGPRRDEITEMAETLNQLLSRIAASRRHEQRFAAEVAHELRTPLAAIRGVAELARNTDELAEAASALAQIEDQSQRISATLDTLIAFARRESTPASDGVDLAEVASGFPGVRVLGGHVPRVEGDPALIRQVLAPLIENARRHAVSSVRVELDTRDGMAVAAVRDDGPGVDPELGTRVFLPGVRGPAELGDGAGLGLPLAQRLAHSCGGEIELGEGPGGCFLVLLPALEPAPPH
jgi:signal transduction histidine kinase